VSRSLAVIQAQADALASGAAAGSVAAAIRAETERVRSVLRQLGPPAQVPAPARAPAPPQVAAPPPRSFGPAPPISPETISVARAVPSPARRTIPPLARVVATPVAPSPGAARPVVTAPASASASGPTAPAMPRPPAIAGVALPSSPAGAPPAAPAASSTGAPTAAAGPTLDTLLVEVVRAQRAALAARPVGVESRIPRGTALPRARVDVVRSALGLTLQSAAATARPSSVVSARAERKPVLLRARDGSEVRRDFVMVALAQQGGPSEADQQAVLAGRGQGPLAEAQRHVREMGGFLRFAPLPQGGVETRLFLPA